MSSTKKRKRICRLKGILLLILLGVCLQHVPGTYTIDDFQDDFELTSSEGIALLALSEASLSAECYFKESALHRISRNAEIWVPDDTRIQISATTVPFIQDGEVLLRPATLEIQSDKPLTFIYRFVTVARAKTLHIQPGDPDAKVKAVGQYKILSALLTAYRYKRQNDVKRDYKIPSVAKVDFEANFQPDHELKPLEGISLFTGSYPGHLRIRNALWQEHAWQAGTLHLSLPFADLNPLVDQLLQTVLPKKIELGDMVDLTLEKIQRLNFSDNFMDLVAEGKLAYAKSQKVTQVFHPTFKTHLGIQFTFPEKVFLKDATAAAELKNVFSLDFNRSNPVFDKMARNLVRGFREDARVEYKLKEAIPDDLDLFSKLYIDYLRLLGNENGHPQLDARILIHP